MKCINLKIPAHSYFFGFVQTDGSLSRFGRFPNKGKLQIEVGEKDLHILKSFRKLFPSVYSSVSPRVRDTNFKNNYRSYVLGIFNMAFRKEINQLGIPYGKKSEIISPPNDDFNERDYIRGLIDGDGSIGLTNREVPFINITVKSDKLKNYLFDIIEKITGERKKINRNKRDGIYNIMVNREKAQQFIEYLYYPRCLALKRKLKKAKEALKWERPKTMTRILFQKDWEGWEDKYVLTHSIEESCERLKRTENSIGMRLWRFKTNKIKI